MIPAPGSGVCPNPGSQGDMIIIIMGVCGAGKTTVGTLLAQSLGADYHEGDDFHPPANVEKMKSGAPLNDEDRGPWLIAIADAMDRWRKEGRNVVLSCSALKQSYRDMLTAGKGDVRLVYLKGSEELIRARLHKRGGHFMPTALLASQFAALEEPAKAVTMDIGDAPAVIVAAIRAELRLIT